MSHFIATLAPQRGSNWDICRSTGLWGVVGRGTNWRSNAVRVENGDDIYVWRGGRDNGFIAHVRARGRAQMAGSPGVVVPWPDPEWFGAVIPFDVIAELTRPETDSFPNSNGRVSQRFGFNNTALQHIFEQVPTAVGRRIQAVFPGA